MLREEGKLAVGSWEWAVGREEKGELGAEGGEKRDPSLCVGMTVKVKNWVIVKVGIRTPSLKKRIAARTSWKRYARQSTGLKAPKGYGWITNPKKALYNRVYYRTTRGCSVVLILMLSLFGSVTGCFAWILISR